MGRPEISAGRRKPERDACDHALIEQAKKVKGKAVTLDEYLARRRERRGRPGTEVPGKTAGMKLRIGVAMSLRYRVMLEPEEDGGFVVWAPALPGYATQGATREEALANIREAIQCGSGASAGPGKLPVSSSSARPAHCNAPGTLRNLTKLATSRYPKGKALFFTGRSWPETWLSAKGV